MKGFLGVLALFLGLAVVCLGAAHAEEDPNRNILKQGLLGAGVGAISAEASGGKAGKGALIGAGTNVIGGALLDTLFTSPKPQPTYAQPVQYVEQPVQYVQAAPAQYQQPVYAQQPAYVQQPVYYAPAPQEDPNKKIIKSGLLGAGVGAISASASGGKAGQGALIGAGTNVIGGALLDTLTGPSTPQAQPVYVQQAPVYSAPPQPPTYTTPVQPKKKIVRRFDKDGNVVAEEEVWE